MTINEKIEKLEKELEELKAEMNKGVKWMPYRGEICFGVWTDGEVIKTQYDDTGITGRILSRGRLFKTKEEAEFFSERELVRAELEALADDEQEWDGENEHWKIAYNLFDGITTGRWMGIRHDQPHFKSRESAQSAIDTVGADRIKKYLFGVK